APAAPVFLLIMGVFLGQSRRGVRHGVLRGLRLLALGYLLNFLRFTLPLGIARLEGPLPNAAESPLSLLWAVDILQMAGLSFIVLTLLKRTLPFRWAWVVIAAGVAVLAPLLWGLGASCPLLDLLWGTGANVFFPLFPWLVYPLVGMAYGPYLLEVGGAARVMRRTAALGGLLLAVGAATFFLPTAAIFGVGDYCRSGLGVHLAVLGFVFLWLPLCWVMARRGSDSGGLGLLYFWSRNVTSVYFVQWVLIGWGILLLDSNRCSSPAAVGVGVVVLLLTHITVKAHRALAMRGSSRRAG
ncbi:MAG: DUF1624 domain-containing protein, partial [bacterium]|nr:DUF1624 domain-containing protein [bacterium]